MKPKFFLTQVGIDFFIMRNPHEKLTNRMCNSTMFDFDPKAATLDVSVFDFFNVPVRILGEKLDYRTKRVKALVKVYGYFSAGNLPDIKKKYDLYLLWESFANIPVNGNDEIEESFYQWPKGTDRLVIWRWFDEQSPNGLVNDLMYKAKITS